MSQQESACSPGRVPIITRALDFIGNIWFGMALLALIFIYSFFGSATPAIRAGALADVLHLEFLRFEKSEMEWFSWWPFVTLIALFCLSIIVVTIRKIPLTLLSAGVWAIHLGIIILAAACIYYFGSKVEGDTLIYQAAARIRAPGAPEATLVIRPNAQTFVDTGKKLYQIQVAQIDPDYTPLSGKFKGQHVSQVWLNVSTTDPPSNFIRTMIVGDPDNTEDVIMTQSGAQRAVKMTGQKLVDQDLQIVLDYDPVQYFYHGHELPVHSDGAIYVRPVGAPEWTQLRIDWLPQYYEYVTHRDELWPTEGSRVPIRPLDRPAVKGEDAGWLKGVDIRVTDYLPYAEMDTRFVDAGPNAPLNPMLRFRLGDDANAQAVELLAADPRRSHANLMGGFDAGFLWVATAAERAELIRPRDPRLKIRVPSKNIEKELKLSALNGAGAVPLDGTDYTLDLRTVLGAAQAGGHPLVMVHVVKGTAAFDRVAMAGDTDGGQDLDRPRQPVADPDFKLEYLDPVAPGLQFIAGPDSAQIDVLLTRNDGQLIHQAAALGDALNVLPAVAVHLEKLIPNAREESRPAITPPSERERLQGRIRAIARVEISDGQRIQGLWLPFAEYPMDDIQHIQPGRMMYVPRQVMLDSGQQIEVLFSRQREPLASPVALDRFIREAAIDRDRNTETDFISLIRFADPTQPDGWSERAKKVHSNEPVQHGDYWYFQSKWDPEFQCHTVLGVGNRKGITPMLVGVCISIAGMIYAFYVKPAIRRRRQANRTDRTLKLAEVPPPVLSPSQRREHSVRARSNGDDYPTSPGVEAQT
jgi:hypothetical protein